MEPVSGQHSVVSSREVVYARLADIAGLTVRCEVMLSSCTRFGVGGPADLFVETNDVGALVEAVRVARTSGFPHYLIGEGSNLIASDGGFRGIILRYTNDTLRADGQLISAGAGASLQALVDFANEKGLRGLEALAGIPGSVGAAVYGNAGAYGQAIADCLTTVRALDDLEIRQFDRAACLFRYRESVFKKLKGVLILDADLEMTRADPEVLKAKTREIVALRNQKFPPQMRCAGSIFKNLLIEELPSEAAQAVPQEVVREGKVPAAYFLERAGAKGLKRGRIRVADYHANLLYNEGGGTAADLRDLIAELGRRVRDRFGIGLEEEVQYLGFDE